jgi:hypothetical protein
LPSVQGRHSAKLALPSVKRGALDKEASLSSARTRLSAKITTVSFRRQLTALCRALPFAECLALGKDVFTECFPVPRVLLSVNMIVTESRTLPSVALDKDFFAKCPTKNTRQSTEHLAKCRIPVVIHNLLGFELGWFGPYGLPFSSATVRSYLFLITIQLDRRPANK